MKALVQKYQDIFGSPLGKILKFALSPGACVRETMQAIALRHSISFVHVPKGYSIVPASSLDHEQKEEKERLLRSCRHYVPCACREGVAMLEGSQVVGAWEFERQGNAINLVAVSSDEKMSLAFARKHGCGISEYLFYAIVELCKTTGCGRISYIPDKVMERMMNRFMRQELLSEPEKREGRIFHQVNLDEFG